MGGGTGCRRFFFSTPKGGSVGWFRLFFEGDGAMKHRGVWAWMTGLVWVCAGAWAGPISNMTFEEAVAKSKEEGGWLLVAPFSPECLYCEMSLNETLSSGTMARWLEEGITVIRVNIRADLDAARALHVGQMPAYIVFKDGEEFDRFGKQSLRGEDAEKWLVEVRGGARRHARLLEEAGDRGQGKVDVDRRRRLAAELVEAGEYVLAREEYVWLWKNIGKHSRAHVGVRGSFMAGEMQDLAALDRESRDAFAALRDETEADLKADRGTWQTIDDWLTLNDVVGDQDRVLAWFDRVKETPEGRATIGRVGYRLGALLLEHRRWKDYVLTNPRPLSDIRSAKEARDMHPGVGGRLMDDPVTGERVSVQDRLFRHKCAELYAAFLGAEKDDEARKIAELAMEFDTEPQMIVALVRGAHEIGQERAEHLEMLEAARALGADVAALDAAVRSALKRRS